jgi:hypothetical protein
MSYLIQTAPGATPIEIEVVDREPRHLTQGRQLPEVLHFRCNHPFQPSPVPRQPRIHDDAGRIYDFIPIALKNDVHVGYVREITPA